MTTRRRALPPTIAPDPKHSTEYVTAWGAQSRTHANIVYTVIYDRLENAWACQCPGYGFHGGCAHVDACIEDLVASWRRRDRVAA